jgi:hypothetical protein
MYWRWTEEENQFAQDMIDGNVFNTSEMEISRIVVGVEITKDKMIDVVGSENVRRYWNDGIPGAASFILGNGSNDWNTIYQELEDSGWKSRSISLLKEIVEHYRSIEFVPAVDEIVTTPVPIDVFKKQKDCFYTGRIGCLTDKNGEIVAISVKFPYDEDLLFIVRRITGRKWNGAAKRWEFPLSCASRIFSTFSEFELSENAKKLKDEIS